LINGTLVLLQQYQNAVDLAIVPGVAGANQPTGPVLGQKPLSTVRLGALSLSPPK
jgi:hypothetical protein